MAGAERSPWLQPFTLLALGICAVWLLAALSAPLLGLHDPLAVDLPRLAPPSAQQWMGTDFLGRDVFSRIIWGSRNSIAPALAVVAIITLVGTVIGAVAGYYGSFLDGLLMRISDLVFAFPTIILAMTIVTIIGPGLLNAVLAVAIARWPATARIVRGMVLSLKDSEYVQARRLLGASVFRLLASEILPNAVGPIAVLAALEVGQIILVLAGLSFLGLGTVPPTPDWGTMVADGTQVIWSWWVGTFPGLAIFSVVIACNFLGDIARDRFDPRLVGSDLGRRA